MRKIVRTCPRCHKRLYHWLRKILKNHRMRWEADCADCGHTWRVRPRKDETEGIE